jgi:hypothetical protein
MTEEERRAAKANKTAAKQEKEAEKSKKTEADRLAREEQRKSKEVSAAAATAEGTVAARDNDDLYQDPTPSADSQRTVEHDATDPASPTSPNSSKGFKSLLSKLKRRSKHLSTTETGEKTKEKEPGFIGGNALRTSTSQANSQSQSSKSASQPTRESIESRMSSDADKPTEVSQAEPTHVPHLDHVDEDRYSDVSSLSSDGEEFMVARGRSPKRVISSGTAASGRTDDFEEARDHFDEDLAPPPAFGSDIEKGRKGSPSRESKFQEVGL